MSNLRWKLITILIVFVVFFGLGVYPILAVRYNLPAPQWLRDMQLKLGLDLKGGVHLVLRVQTDDALRVKTEQDSGRLQEELKRRGVPATVTIVDVTTFRVDGVPPAQEPAFRQAAEQEAVDFDRSPGTGGSHTFRMRPNIAQRLREEAVVQARQTIERRVNELGVTEPSIAQQGADQILVQLPGVSDVDRAKQVIGSPGMLELKLVEQGPAASREDVLRATGGVVPSGMEVLTGPGDATTGGPAYYLVRRVAAVTGQDLRSARVQLDENNMPAVGFTLNSSGAASFARVTGENIGRFLAIVLDKTVQSAPRINGRIAADGQIAGGFTQEEAQNLALILRSGALPATLTYLQEQTIGPTLGADSIRAGVLASLAGLLLIVAFLLFYYRLSGVNADRRARHEPDHPARHDGVCRRGHDAARHRRLHPHDRHRRRFERADLRAHQGRARGAARASGGDQCRLQPRVPDARRHARGGLHCRGVPVPVRHRPDSRVRGHADLRA